MFKVSDLFDEVGTTPKGKPQVTVSPSKVYPAYLDQMGLGVSVRNVAAAKKMLQTDCLRKFPEGVQIKIKKALEWSMAVLAAKERPELSGPDQMAYAEAERSAGMRMVAVIRKELDAKRLQEVL